MFIKLCIIVVKARLLGHHRLKAAKDLELSTIKVNQIITYSQSVKTGITELPLGQVPKGY